MKLLINASTLSGTGVSQVAMSFIVECMKHSEHEFFIYASPHISTYLKEYNLPQHFKIFTFGASKLYSFRGRKDVKKMKELEVKIKPDCVFSIFGPSWWRPQAPHLMGFAYGHYIYQDSPFYDIISVKEKFLIKTMMLIHKRALLHNGDYYVSETEDVARRLKNYLKIDGRFSFVVPNTANNYFLEDKYTDIKNDKNEVFSFYTLCSCARHKNLEILNSVIPILKKRSLNNIRFYTTLPDSSYNKIFTEDSKDMIINVGPLRIEDCPSFVASKDALFLPTLIECFSASYPEAMIMGKPILTSDLSFARSICENSAIYFNPLDANNIADAIEKIVYDDNLYNRKKNEVRERFKSFITPSERANMYLDICNKISNNNDKI